MQIKGKVFIFGDNINTDLIIPARYLLTSDPQELAKYCFEDIRPGFGQRNDVQGSIVIAGENFGSSSSREHAPLAIKGAGINCVLAKSFSRIFLRNAINIGLPIGELSLINEFKEGDEIEINFSSGKIVNRRTQKTFEIKPYPPFLQEIIISGGWLNYLKTLGTKEER